VNNIGRLLNGNKTRIPIASALGNQQHRPVNNYTCLAL